MANTLVYDEGVNGWPSFYSYDPDYMIGMNNYFYSFNGGNLYRHNTNETRNNFYGVQYNSTVTSVFNDNPLENKIFKTINLEGDSRWSITLASDIQVGGFVEASYYEEKEGSFYAFVRNAGTIPAQASEYVLRSLNGIGRSESVTGGTIVSFDLSTDLSTIMSVGDALYFALPPYTAPQLAGTITSINITVNVRYWADIRPNGFTFPIMHVPYHLIFKICYQSIEIRIWSYIFVLQSWRCVFCSLK